MTDLEKRLRVNVTKLQSEGVAITFPEPRKEKDLKRGGFHFKTDDDELRCPRAWNMPNVTDAVNEYRTHKVKYRGLLKELAIKYHTTPGSISGRIKREKL